MPRQKIMTLVFLTLICCSAAKAQETDAPTEIERLKEAYTHKEAEVKELNERIARLLQLVEQCKAEAAESKKTADLARAVAVQSNKRAAELERDKREALRTKPVPIDGLTNDVYGKLSVDHEGQVFMIAIERNFLTDSALQEIEDSIQKQRAEMLKQAEQSVKDAKTRLAEVNKNLESIMAMEDPEKKNALLKVNFMAISRSWSDLCNAAEQTKNKEAMALIPELNQVRYQLKKMMRPHKPKTVESDKQAVDEFDF